MLIFQTERWSYNKECYYGQTSSIESQENQTQAAARTRIWHAKNESNIYNKLFMLACPIHITIMLQQRWIKQHTTYDKLQAGENLVHVVRYPASDHALIHRFWATTGSWYWFKELLNLWCTSCKRPTPEIVSRILLDNICKATMSYTHYFNTEEWAYSMDNKGNEGDNIEIPFYIVCNVDEWV